ncbi:MAG: DUF1877 family protein [Spirulina sp. SIO3F2]|nr:DUF1877 family protein [Spirulina sp. SIO3F2]
MGIVVNLKQISLYTLEVLQQSPTLGAALFDAQYLPESPFWNTSEGFDEYDERTKKEARMRFDRCVFRALRDRLSFWDRLSDFLVFEVISKFISHDRTRPKSRRPKHLSWHQAIEQHFLTEWEIPELDLGKNLYELTLLLSGYAPAYYHSSDGLLLELESYKGRGDGEFLSFLVVESSDYGSPPLVNAVGAGTQLEYETGYGPVRYLLPNENEQILSGLLRLTKEDLWERYRTELRKEKPCSWFVFLDEEILEGVLELYDEIVFYYNDAVKNQRVMLLYLT